jgi:hypothetical protein
VYHLDGPTDLKSAVTTSLFGRRLWVRSATDKALILTRYHRLLALTENAG